MQLKYCPFMLNGRRGVNLYFVICLPVCLTLYQQDEEKNDEVFHVMKINKNLLFPASRRG